MNKTLNNLVFIWSIMLLTTMMTIMPLPDFFHGIRIEWVSLLTGYKGHGSWSDYLDPGTIEYLNKKYKHEIEHWMVTCNSH